MAWVEWFCDGCGEQMNDQPGFTTDSGEWICTECGYPNDVTDDNIIWDDDPSYYSGIPEGCAACGGPYPNCKDSCPIFDD